MVDVKFCGMTRVADAGLAAELGARYVGVIFAESPRRVDRATARSIATVAKERGASVIGVFGAAVPSEVVATAHEAGLDGVQLHGDATAAGVREVRGMFDGEVWAVARVEGATLPPAVDDLADAADGLLLDARVPGALGGTGHRFDWNGVRGRLAALRGTTRLIVAGGLSPENVADAIAALSPDVVDVSSGVESSPGVKDASRLRAFMDAVRGAAGR